MNRKVPPESITKTVHAGERLRMELLDALRLTTVPEERAAVVTEMVMLFGQAFERVYDACARQPAPRPLTVKVLHECVGGLAIYKLWLVSETPVDAQEDYERMMAHWQNVTGMVLGKGE